MVLPTLQVQRSKVKGLAKRACGEAGRSLSVFAVTNCTPTMCQVLCWPWCRAGRTKDDSCPSGASYRAGSLAWRSPDSGVLPPPPLVQHKIKRLKVQFTGTEFLHNSVQLSPPFSFRTCHHPKGDPAPRSSQAPTRLPRSPWEPPRCCPCLWIYQCWVCPTDGSHPRVPFPCGFFPPSSTFSGFRTVRHLSLRCWFLATSIHSSFFWDPRLDVTTTVTNLQLPGHLGLHLTPEAGVGT